MVVEQLRPNTVGVFRANDDACFHACLHGGDKKAAFSEIYRVLRRGGRLQLKIDVSDRGFGHGFAVRHISSGWRGEGETVRCLWLYFPRTKTNVIGRGARSR